MQTNTPKIMMKHKDFAVFILTYQRPENVITYKSLQASGYSGPVYLIVDEADSKLDQYNEMYPGIVVTFNREEVSKTFDKGDNFPGMRGVVYARNANFEIARRMGFKYFAQFDDDYYFFHYRFGDDLTYKPKQIKNLDKVFDIILQYLKTIPALCVAMAQGGDFIGGSESKFASELSLKRKCMNTFFCDVDKPFQFLGSINEDVTAYVRNGERGQLFFTLPNVSINQLVTQTNAGGLTEQYLDIGTYVKSFYSVMYSPSCVTINTMGRNCRRLHHRVNWGAAVPLILDEKHKKK